MSFVYIAAVVFLFSGIIAGYSYTSPRKKSKILSNIYYRKIYLSIVCIALIGLLISSSRHANANKLFQTAEEKTRTTTNYYEMTTPLNKALSYYLHPEYVTLKLNILLTVFNQVKDPIYLQQYEQLLMSFKEKEPLSPIAFEHSYQLAQSRQNTNQIENLLEDALKNYRWNIKIYERKMSFYFQQGFNNHEEKNKYWDTALNVYRDLQNQIKSLSSTPTESVIGKPFEITPYIKLIVGQIYFYRGDYTIAEQILVTELNSQFPTEESKVIARYYLATIQHLGKKADDLLAMLVARDPSEKEKLGQLLQQSGL